MKCLILFSLAFLLFLSSEVSSQNPNMFDIEVTCYDSPSQACHRVTEDIYIQAGQIVSNNLILTGRISVEIVVKDSDATYYGYTIPSQVPYGDAEGGVVLYYPTALIKQFDPGFQHDGPDIVIEINSRHDNNILYYREDPIEENQVDVLVLVLHELQHGLGIVTDWDYIQGNDLIPDYDYHKDSSGVLTFYNFFETVFDKYLVSLNKNRGDHITNYVQDLSVMAGPSGRIYNSEDDFTNNLRAKQQEEQRSYTSDLFNMVITPHDLGFLPKTSSSPEDAFTLDTSYNPLEPGSSIIHLDQGLYAKSSDFLFTPALMAGKKLEAAVEAYGNAPGNGMGPNLMSMLETMGYQRRINPTKSKRSKPKRIVKYS